MSFRAALEGKVLIGMFEIPATFPLIPFGFDIPAGLCGRVDPNTAVVFMAAMGAGIVQPIRYRVHSFTSSRVEFAISSFAAPPDTIYILIVS